MPKFHIKRFRHRNGKVHAEIRSVGGKLHGRNRTWHFNGQLAEELCYRHGLMHGTSRHWHEDGRLLGSFTMNAGTGTQRSWHDNGQLKIEVDSLLGKCHGRTRIWLRNGAQIQETFYIANKEVTRAIYLKAARIHPDWPQYERELAGKVIRKGIDLERLEYKLFVESLLDNSHAEAKEWLSAGKIPDSRSFAKFRTARAALRFVETLYAAGASTVLVLPVYMGKRGKQFADWLLIKLPKVLADRSALRTLCRDFCRQRDGSMLPDKDFGESYLFLRLA